jgi:rfaE bifunctional protein kinase chain/domain
VRPLPSAPPGADLITASGTRDSLASRVRAMSGRTVLVVGDVILDRYLWGRASRVSPEAPVLVVDVEREELRLGGAANVAHNVRALGATPILCGLLGEDGPGADCARLLAECRVDAAPGIVRDAGRRTTMKTRILAHHQQVLRADEESKEPAGAPAAEALWERVRAALDRVDAAIVSDYGKGVVTPELLDRLLPELSRRGVPVAVDPKEEHFFRYRGVTVITPNVAEASQAWGRKLRDLDSLLEAGFGLRERLEARSVLITRGEEGMSLFTAEGHTHFPTRAREVYDVTGAGDTVVATMGAALAARATLPEASILANHAAGLVVAHVGTAAAGAAELITSIEEPALG